MAQVLMPQKKQGSAQALQLGGTVAGAIGGGMSGGPGGAAEGASKGAAMGGAAAGLMGGNNQAVSAPKQSNAMDRRMEMMRPSQEAAADLANAESALAYLPPEQQKAYAPAIKKARYLNEQEGVA